MSVLRIAFPKRFGATCQSLAARKRNCLTCLTAFDVYSHDEPSLQVTISRECCIE